VNLTLKNAAHPFRAASALVLMFRTIDNPGAFLSDVLGLSRGDVTYLIKDGSIRVHARAGTPDFYEILVVLGGREYDLALVTLRTANRPVIVDVGAHIGTFTLLALDHFRDLTPTVVAVEPALDNHEYLLRNLEANTVLTRKASIHIVQAALGPTDGFASLDRNVPADSYRLALDADIDGQGAQKCEVVSTTTLCSRFGLRHVDILKLDIEGSEHDVFRNAETLGFVEANVDHIFMEVHDVAPERGSRTLMPILDRSFETISQHDRVVVLRNRRLEAG
jgi:FkbM family methyltransferase